jgi:preprotein translocase subunit SecA
MIRKDQNDLVYLNQEYKYQAIVNKVQECTKKGQPVLVGTASVESSEILSHFLKGKKVDHNILNAKFHEQEAHIIANAGKSGAVTIATNMAGRGTDIVLGGSLEEELKALDEGTSTAEIDKLKADWETRHEQVLAAGGLMVIGTERHESRRVDNQLRGRSGRQGDPGESRFYLSLEDHLLRLFIPEGFKALFKSMGDQAIDSKLITRSVEKAQKKVEGRNFDIRKSLLEYDAVTNEQRQQVYEQRDFILESESIAPQIESMRASVINAWVDTYIPRGSLSEQWRLGDLSSDLRTQYNLDFDAETILKSNTSLTPENLKEQILEALTTAYQDKASGLGEKAEETLKEFEKTVLLQTLDQLWKEHLASLDYLRKSTSFRGYAQKNPKHEYKREAFELYGNMLNQVKLETIRALSRAHIPTQEEIEAIEAQQREAALKDLQMKHPEFAAQLAENLEQPEGGEVPEGAPVSNDAPVKAAPVRNEPKVGRNEPCPCGSGKKYKHCCGKL